MTFLLFLASVAVLEYLLRDYRPGGDGKPRRNKIDAITNCDPAAGDSTADLLSLGRALHSSRTDEPAKQSAPAAKERTVN